MFEMSRWIFEGGGWIRLSEVTLAETGAILGKGRTKPLFGFSPRKLSRGNTYRVERMLRREMGVVDERFDCLGFAGGVVVVSN